ncbi:hypothetical protein [Photorhabdus temperata]|uniref:phage tail fiber protein n=1 Tax=Photorhabdus temperata TaxID=574560 RepID=UPI000389E4A4|nr:hypothetical protein [Photorhabdus temperata]EQC00785.1 hypothetical protein B738_09064 [Photorhabdus temperata subsp. temperata M1021]
MHKKTNRTDVDNLTDAPVFARNAREGYANGDLIDIPPGRFVSVRVQMPGADAEKLST